MIPETMTEGPFELVSQWVGALPILSAFIDALGVEELLEQAILTDSRSELPPARALGVLLRNLIEGPSPLYGLGEWVRSRDPRGLGLCDEEVAAINDDRVGRGLDRLYDADRGALGAEIVLGAIRRYGIDVDALHNDSTSISLTGEYRGADGGPKRSKPSVKITRGHSKDHRPDLKQLLWVLTVSGDGAVPVHYRLTDGNTSDSSYHIEVWETLTKLVGRADFVYFADSKLASRQNMDHIHRGGGRFISVLPRSRKEDAEFRDWVKAHRPSWVPVRDDTSEGAAPDVFLMAEAPWPSAEGYRVAWILSSAKAAKDAEARRARIAAASRRLEDLAARLMGPKARIRSIEGADGAVKKILAETGTEAFFSVQLKASTETTLRRLEPRKGSGAEGRYRRIDRTRIELTWEIDATLVAAEAASDGMFPLITNCTQMSLAELFAHYKYQPCLERRHRDLKSGMEVSEMFLKKVTRIEGVLFLYFVALLVRALIEREIRRNMEAEELATLPLYPEDRDCAAPTAGRILSIFAPIQRHGLVANGEVVQTFEPQLTALQLRVLKLLGLSPSIYARPPV